MLQLFVYFFTVTAFAQTFCVLLGYWSYDTVTDLIPNSSFMAHAIKNGAAHGGKIKPSSVFGHFESSLSCNDCRRDQASHPHRSYLIGMTRKMIRCNAGFDVKSSWRL
jgi:hypothetical protein